MDAVDDVGADEGEPAEATTVHHTDRQRRTVDLLLFFQGQREHQRLKNGIGSEVYVKIKQVEEK